MLPRFKTRRKAEFRAAGHAGQLVNLGSAQAQKGVEAEKDGVDHVVFHASKIFYQAYTEALTER